MGNANFKNPSVVNGLTRKNFEFKYIIGKGGFGIVWKALMKNNQKLVAIKEMFKSKIIEGKFTKSVINERLLLGKIKHPFIVNMKYAFQDKSSLYLVMDLLTGGDLRYNLRKNLSFNEEQTKFIVCCIIVGLEYLHKNKIAHRDIKPENMIFDENGYLSITDFGIAKLLGLKPVTEYSGTLGYMSPETMRKKQQGIESDYYSLGILAYECMKGRRPFGKKTREKLIKEIETKKLQLKKSDFPPGWSPEAADFINKMIRIDPTERLGYHGAHEVKSHEWFYDVDWEKVLSKTAVPPYKPTHSEDIMLDLGKSVLENKETVDTRLNNSLFGDYNFDNSIRNKSTENTSKVVT